VRRALPDAAAALGTLLIAASAWLFWPRDRFGDSSTLPPLRVVLVDTSASAVWRRSGWNDRARAILREQRDMAQRGGEDLAIVLFAWDVRRIYGPAPSSGFDATEELPGPIGGEASRVAGGLEVARELVEAQVRSGSRVVLVGDGTYTGTDPRPLLRLLAGTGVQLERVDLPPADVEEVVPGELSLPAEVEVGAPITASFDLQYTPGAAGRKSQVTLSLGSRTIDVPVPSGIVADDDGYLRWHVRTEVGTARAGWNPVRIGGWRYTAAAVETDRGTSSSGVVRGAGQRLVAYVVGGPRNAVGRPPERRASPISGDGLELVPLYPHELAAQIERFDAVETFDLPPRDLPLPILRSFVERGGGWLATIAEDSASSFVAGSAADFLPLLPPDDDPEPRDVIFLVDRSGSMSEDRTESVRRAVFALMDEAAPSDSVELRWFSESLSPAIHLIGPADSKRPLDREEARRLAADRLFSTQAGGGPTALLRSLRELAEIRSRTGREALVFLLSDGRDNTDPDPLVSAPLVMDRVRAARVRLVVIAAGVHVERELLSRLVDPDQEVEEVGSLLDAADGSAVRSLFRRELNRERIREGMNLRILPGEPQGLGAEILRAMKPELWSNNFPSTSSYVRARSAPGAEVLWVAEAGEPLLALQRVGLGLTAAYAFSTAGWRDAGNLYFPLMRALARGRSGERPSIRVEGSDLVVEGLPETSPPDLEALVFASHALESDPPCAVIPLTAPVEGGDPRRVRRGRWPSDATEALSALWDEHDLELQSRQYRSARVPRVEIRASESTWAPIQLALAPPRAVEFVLPRPRIPPFETIAVDRSESRATRPRSHPSAPWVLLSGLLLLAGAGFAGSFSRRVR